MRKYKQNHYPQLNMPASHGTFMLPCLVIISTFFGYSGYASASQAELKIELPATIDLTNARVFYQQDDATPFAIIDTNTVRLSVPFPDKDGEFTVTIIDDRNGNSLFTEEYTLTDGLIVPATASTSTGSAPSSVESDTTEVDDYREADDLESATVGPFQTNAQGQLDLSALSNMSDGSDYEVRETEDNGESDLLASFSVDHDYNRLSTSLAIEAVHRSNPDNTLRYEGPPADISNFISSLGFAAGDGSTFSLSAGDINIGSKNSLVNSGMSSRGFSVGFQSPNNRLSWEVGRLYGSDIVGAQKGPLGLSGDSYRVGYNIELALFEQPTWAMSVNASLLDVKRSAEDDNFGFGETTDGEKNKVWGIGSDLNFLDNKLNLSFNWARSDYDNPADLNEENFPDDPTFVVYDPGTTSGNAYQHNAEWTAWSDDSGSKSIGFELSAERVTPFYRSVQGITTADRRQYSAHTTIGMGAGQLRVGTTRYRNNLNDLISVHTLEEFEHEAQLSIDIESLFDEWLYSSDNDGSSDGKRWRALMPTSADANVLYQGMKTLNGDVIILAPVIAGFDFMNQTTDSLGINFNWENANNSTSVGLDYNYLDNNQRERADADTRDLVYRISHSISKDQWSLTGQIGLTRSSDYDTATRANTSVSEWGLSGSYEATNGISIFFAFDRSTDTLNDIALDETENSFSDAFSLSTDLGQWVGEKLSLTNTPSVTLNLQTNRSNTTNPYFAADQTSRSFTLNVGIPF